MPPDSPRPSRRAPDRGRRGHHGGRSRGTKHADGRVGARAGPAERPEPTGRARLASGRAVGEERRRVHRAGRRAHRAEGRRPEAPAPPERARGRRASRTGHVPNARERRGPVGHGPGAAANPSAFRARGRQAPPGRRLPPGHRATRSARCRTRPASGATWPDAAHGRSLGGTRP